MKNPTIEITETLQHAFEHYNRELFNDSLPSCMITLNRKKSARGYFAKERFVDRIDGDKYHEIALNPDSFEDRDDKSILSTLAHEMCHMWQSEHGIKKAKNGYHNQEWVAKMKTIGLKPYSLTTGDIGTGTKVTHDVISFGLFDSSTSNFLSNGHSIGYQSVLAEQKESLPRKKYSFSFVCPKCGDWAKSHKNRKLVCGECLEMMVMKKDGDIDE
jgi:predicted SprT family Zn-dependent metalloprotease